MTVGTFLSQATKMFTAAGIKSARLDSLILLEDELGVDRAHILAHPDTQLTTTQMSVLNNKCMQRSRHTPLAYIRGKAAFYGHDFTVNKQVLVPRPETESMIELLLTISDLPVHPLLADVGTGSGCIGITAKLAIPGSTVILIDIEDSALAIARLNARVLGAQATCNQQNLLANDTRAYDVILANLPYVPSDYPINTAAKFEPAVALFSGEDGLDLYRTLWHQVATLSHMPAHVITESLRDQHSALTDLASATGYTLQQTAGLAQHFVANTVRR